MLNGVINLFKYPILFLMLLLSVKMLEVLFNLVFIIIEYFHEYELFFFGIVVYMVLWFVLFRNRIGRLLMVLEHELIHALFLLLSLNKIIQIRASIVGGETLHFSSGGGNWLITISPYFFSLLGMILIGITYVATPAAASTLMFFYGYVVMHHLHTIIEMTSRRQSDIQKVGVIYSFLFIPLANILTFILLLTQIPHDRIRLSTVFDYLYNDVFLHGINNFLAIIT